MIVQSLLDFLSHGWDIREKTREVAQVIAEIPSGILLAVELREVLAGDGDGFFRLSHGNSIAEFRVKRSFIFAFLQSIRASVSSCSPPSSSSTMIMSLSRKSTTPQVPPSKVSSLPSSLSVMQAVYQNQGEPQAKKAFNFIFFRGGFFENFQIKA